MGRVDETKRVSSVEEESRCKRRGDERYLSRGGVEDREDGGVDEVTLVESGGRMRGGWCNPAEEAEAADGHSSPA